MVAKASLREQTIVELCHRAREILIEEPMVLQLAPPMVICGDIHGQFFDLLRLVVVIFFKPVK